MANPVCPHFMTTACDYYKKCPWWNYCEARKKFYPDKKLANKKEER